jgi:transposase
VVNRAATTLRLGASTLLRSQTYLGAQYRRLRRKRGAPKAIPAMATGSPDWPIGCRRCSTIRRKRAENYEQRNRQQQIEFVRKKAAQLGLLSI